MWIVRKTKTCKRWFKVKKPAKKQTKKIKKIKKTRHHLKGGSAHIGQKICEVLRLYIPVYAMEVKYETQGRLMKFLSEQRKLGIVDQGQFQLLNKYPQRKRMYEKSYQEFTKMVAQLTSNEDMKYTDLLERKRSELKKQINGKRSDNCYYNMVLDPEGYYKNLLGNIGCGSQSKLMYEVNSK